MLSPFLLVGLGGSGGKTLRTARADLERRLDKLGWDEDFPDAWQFLHIDVPTTPDGFDPELPGGLPSGSYTGLVGAGIDYATIDSVLTTALPGELNLHATAGWRPNPAHVNVPVDKGAGQFRAIGRVITVANLPEIKRAIEDSLGKLRGPEVEGQLKRAAELLGVDPSQAVPDATAILISSIAGGSGAGAVLDVAQVLRSAGFTDSQNIAVMYAPDVFDGLPNQMRKGVRPNALATISELSAAFWNDQGASEATSALYNAKGVALPPGNRTTPRLILVGRSNSTVDYREQNSVYMSMGRALAAWMCSQTVQDEITAYAVTNEDSNSVETVDAFPSMLSHQHPPFRGIGFARVSLGRDLFGEYAAQFLARAAVETILRQHLANRRPGTVERTDKELIEEAANLSFRGFLKRCALDERGPDANDALEAIRPDDRQQRFDAMVNEIASQISTGFGDKPMEVNLIRTRIVSSLEALEPAFDSSEETGQREKAIKWTSDIQAQVMAATIESVAHNGARVTQRMLRRLAKEEIPFLAGELRAEGAEYAHWANDLDGAIQTTLAEAGSTSLPASNPLIDTACEQAAKSPWYRAEERLRELVRTLLQDLGGNFIEPLEQALDSAQQRLAEDEKPAGAAPSRISLWPTEDRIPVHLKRTDNEFLLEDPESFPARLREKVVASVGSDMSEGDAISEAVAQIVVGAADVGSADQTAAKLDRRWVPTITSLRRTGQSPQMARFIIELDESALLKRANDWANDRERAMGRYLAESLSQYLAADADVPEVVSRRRLKFEGQFSAAVRAAEPLVSIDRRMMQKVHSTDEIGNTFIFTEVPFNDRHPGYGVTERVLDQLGIDRNDIKMNYGDSAVGHIDVFSLMHSRYQPIVFDSLMKPIAEEWLGARMDPDRREAFWRWRRSRPLTEFIPVAPTVRLAMIRGWFTAAILGYLRDGENGIEIVDPASRGFAGFPHPLLQVDSSLNSEIVPAVLKSLPIAWLDAATQKDLAPLAAYRRLRKLGGSGQNDDVVTDYSINSELRDWLNEGKRSELAMPLPTPVVSGDERTALANLRVGEWQASYEKMFKQVENDNTPYRAPRSYELRSDIRLALEDLSQAIRNADQYGSSQTKFI